MLISKTGSSARSAESHGILPTTRATLLPLACGTSRQGDHREARYSVGREHDRGGRPIRRLESPRTVEQPARKVFRTPEERRGRPLHRDEGVGARGSPECGAHTSMNASRTPTAASSAKRSCFAPADATANSCRARAMVLEIFGNRKMNRSRRNAEVAAGPPAGVGPAHLQVRSLRRSIEFYATVLGLQVVRDARSGVERFVTMGARGCTSVAIHEELDPTVQISRRGVKTLIVSNLDRVRARSWESGIAIARDDGSPAQIQRSRDRRFLYVRDPDGHELELEEVCHE